MRGGAFGILFFGGICYEKFSIDRNGTYGLARSHLFRHQARSAKAAKAKSKSGSAPHLYQHLAFSTNAAKAKNQIRRAPHLFSHSVFSTNAAKAKNKSGAPLISFSTLLLPPMPQKQRINQIKHLYFPIIAHEKRRRSAFGVKLFCGEDRARGLLNDGGGDAAEEEAFYGAEASAAEDDEIGLCFFRLF